MNGLEHALEEHLRAQLTLLEGCRNRAVAAADPRLASAWIGHFVRLSHGMAATGSAIARLRHAREGAESLRLAPLALPKLPPLPEEGEGVPPQIRKTTPGRISCRINGFESSHSFKSSALLSSPASGGGAECERSEHEAEGGLCAPSPLPPWR